jgi:hypothetical protein
MKINTKYIIIFLAVIFVTDSNAKNDKFEKAPEVRGRN